MNSKLIIWLFVFLAVSTTVIGQTVFMDDFETVPAVNWPDFNNDADPVAQIGRWSEIMEQRSTIPDSVIDVQVCNNSDPGPVAGNNYCIINRVGYAWLRGNLDNPQPVPTIVEFDLYIPTCTDCQPSSSGLTFWVRNATDAAWDFQLSNDYFRANGHITHTQADGGSTTLLNAFELDQWVHVKYHFKPFQKTYDLYVGQNAYTDLDYATDQDQVKQIVFLATSSKSKFYLDNVQVDICSITTPADINRDCKVDLLDFAALANAWLKCNLDSPNLCY